MDVALKYDSGSTLAYIFTLEPFKQLISNGELWLDTISTRNQTSHLYDESILEEVFEKVINQYPVLFEQLEVRMNELI